MAGAGGTGKGTCAREIAERLGIVFLESHVQNIGKIMGFEAYNKISKDEELAFQYAALIEQLTRESMMISLKRSYIVERSSLDYIAYFVNRGLSNSSYINLARTWAMKNYTHIAYIPIEYEAVDKQIEAWKERDEESRKKTDYVIKLELMAFNNVIQLNGSPSERLNQFLSQDLHHDPQDAYGVL